MTKRRVFRPWWLEDGTEICSVCSQLYVYGTEYRCSDCDGAICPECMTHGRSNCLPCANIREDSVEIEIEV